MDIFSIFWIVVIGAIVFAPGIIEKRLKKASEKQPQVSGIPSRSPVPPFAPASRQAPQMPPAEDSPHSPRMQHRRTAESTENQPSEARTPFVSDLKKLVIYSEIMNPKFDRPM